VVLSSTRLPHRHRHRHRRSGLDDRCGAGGDRTRDQGIM